MAFFTEFLAEDLAEVFLRRAEMKKIGLGLAAVAVIAGWAGLASSVDAAPKKGPGSTRRVRRNRGNLFDKWQEEIKRREDVKKEFEKWSAQASSLTLPDTTPSFTDDLDAVAKQVDQTGKEKGALALLRKKRDLILAKWDAGGEKSLKAAREKIADLNSRREEDLKTCISLVKSMQSVLARREKLAIGQERRMFSSLTAEQRGLWNGPILAEAVVEALALTDLSESQQAKIQALCAQRMRTSALPLVTPLSTAVLASSVRKISASVLTVDQRKEYLRQKRENSITG
jgi:hypothetical protein